MRQVVEVRRHTGRRGKAAHHQEQRQRRDLAVDRKPVTSVEAALSDGSTPMNSAEAMTPTSP